LQERKKRSLKIARPEGKGGGKIKDECSSKARFLSGAEVNLSFSLPKSLKKVYITARISQLITLTRRAG
jgi:hypothetical protein